MADVDDDAMRAAIKQAQGGDEVWTLARTYYGEGRVGVLTIRLWHHPEDGYIVAGEDEGGNRIGSNNPTADPVNAVLLAHWHEVSRHDM